MVGGCSDGLKHAFPPCRSEEEQRLVTGCVQDLRGGGDHWKRSHSKVTCRPRCPPAPAARRFPWRQAPHYDCLRSNRDRKEVGVREAGGRTLCPGDLPAWNAALRNDDFHDVSMPRPRRHGAARGGGGGVWKHTLLSFRTLASYLVHYVTGLCNQCSPCEARAAPAIDGQR